GGRHRRSVRLRAGRQPLAWRRVDHRAAVDESRRRDVTDRDASGQRRRGDDATLSRGLGRDGAGGGKAQRTKRGGAGRGPDRRGPPAVSGGAGACGYAFLAASIFSKISSLSGKRYVS